MIAICVPITPTPVPERGWVLMLLRPDEELHRGGLSKQRPSNVLTQSPLRPPQWVRLPRRFVCKRYALRTIRREIRTGAAVAAKLYWGTELQGYWQKCPTTGRELKMHVCEDWKGKNWLRDPETGREMKMIVAADLK